MEPILLVHGYSAEGRKTRAEDIYGSLPEELRKRFGPRAVREIDLSRWISLDDGVRLDDVSFAMDRALRTQHPDLLQSGFHSIIHSTGALVVRNWIRQSGVPGQRSPLRNLIHLAGANFGSGLAHIGQGQLSRWGRLIFQGTESGTRILNELEFGSWSTLDLHLHFLQPGRDMVDDYGVQEFCIIGSQTLPLLRVVPIRYVKEDSSDGTVRTCAGNLNFTHISIRPRPDTLALPLSKLKPLMERRLDNERLDDGLYAVESARLSSDRRRVPFAVAWETAHFGDDIGIVAGSKNRSSVMPLIKAALETPPDPAAYAATAQDFAAATAKTFERAAALKGSALDWDKQEQYEGHAQVIFRLRDQYGNGVEHFDITFKSRPGGEFTNRLETMIEDHHRNRRNAGTLTFYLRTQEFKRGFVEKLERVAPMTLEVTGHEPHSGEIEFVPLSLPLSPKQLRGWITTFQTTVIDITLARLPSGKVFEIKRDGRQP